MNIAWILIIYRCCSASSPPNRDWNVLGGALEKVSSLSTQEIDSRPLTVAEALTRLAGTVTQLSITSLGLGRLLSTMNTVTLPLEIFLHIFLYLSIEDILALRQVRENIVSLKKHLTVQLVVQTCKDFQAMTQSRSVWSLLYQTYVLEQDIPTPQISNERPIELMAAHDLEGMTIRSLRLRNKWTSAFPLAARKTTIMSQPTTDGNPLPRVISLHFLPGHGARWLISVHALHIGGQVVFTVRNWDLLANPPIQTSCLTSHAFSGLAINAQAEQPFVLAVQRPQ